jgi:putative radical SAM enzyme (TIGR03279 family)
MVEITDVQVGGRAARAGIRAGDVLVSINGNAIRDVLDYRFYLAERTVVLTVQRGDETLSFTLRKGEYDDIGLAFATPLMDKKHTCRNKCVFCFVDQMPKGMRETLYFKDDDDRLSFLHGNYVTLTNLADEDIDRLIKMHISPINVSVHTTNPELRVKMMKNPRAGEVLSYLDRLADAGIALCTQIVLCRGLNDGEELLRSMRDLEKYYPALRSCAIVPVGLTRYREGLYPLELFSAEECREVIRAVDAFGDECKKTHGTRLFYCADEFYVKAGLPLPEEAYYEEYSQIENGVGMLRSLSEEFSMEAEALSDLLADAKLPRHVTVATGVAAYGTLAELCCSLSDAVKGLTVDVVCIENRFFGPSVTVAGLLTGKDLSEQLAGRDLGDELLIPAAMLRADGDVFLDDMTPTELSEKLHGVRVTPVGSDGAELLSCLLGIGPLSTDE